MTAARCLIKRCSDDSVGLMGTGTIVAHEDRVKMTWNALERGRRHLPVVLTRDSCTLPDSSSPSTRNRHGAGPVFFGPCRADPADHADLISTSAAIGYGEAGNAPVLASLCDC